MTENSVLQEDIFNPQEETLLLYKKWREKFVMPLLVGTLALGVLVLIPAVNSAEHWLFRALFIAAYVMTGVVTVIKFSYAVRINVFLFGVYALGLAELLRYGILGDGTFFFLGLVVFSTLLFSPRAGVISIALTLLTLLISGWLMLSEVIQPFISQTASAELSDWLSGGAMILMFGAVIILGFQRLETAFVEAQRQVDETLTSVREERNNLEKHVAERTRQLRRVNEIGSVIAAILDPEELLTRAAQLISDEFECYHTAIFLTDASGQWAELKAATGEAGKVLLENKHHANLNGNNPVATAIRARQACVIADTAAEATHSENPAQPFTRFSWHGISITPQFERMDNPLLPETRSQITLPLIVGERVIGALDMHSKKENAFLPQNADAYQNMANQVAIALENSRLFREAQQSIREMDATQQQYLKEAWLSLAREQNFDYALGAEDAIKEQRALEIPLTLRDQVIGRINLAAAEGWSPEQKSLIEAVASQAALALENARLVQESQSVAMRERLASEITAKIWASRTMDNILQTTVRELGRALEAAEVSISIGAGGENE